MALTMAEVARDYETDGVPSSGPHKIKKNNLRGWGAWVEGIINAFVNVNGGTIYSSKAAMDADLSLGSNSMAWVMGDPVAANNGVYRKTGAPGTGSWIRIGDLPYSFIIASDAGAGTANAIQATTSIPVSGSALIWMNIFEANTASPATVSFNGGATLTVKTNSGNDVTIGGLTAGMIVMGVISGSTFRLISDQASSAILAQAEAAAATATAAAASLASRVGYSVDILDYTTSNAQRTALLSGSIGFKPFLDDAIADAVSRGIKVVSLSEGNFELDDDDLINNPGICIRGVAGGTRLHKNGSGRMFQTVGAAPNTATDGYALTANVAAGATSVTLSAANAANFTAGSRAILWANVITKSDSARDAEYVKIINVNTTTGVITFASPIYFAYTTANGAKLFNVDLVEGVGYENLIIDWTDGTPTSPARPPYNVDEAFALWFCENPVLRNISSKYMIAATINLHGCVNAFVDGLYCRDGFSDGTDMANAYAYGIAESGLNLGLRATNLLFERMRHGSTTGGPDSSDSTMFNGGHPFFSLISNGVHRDAKEAGFDSHAAGIGCRWVNLHTIGGFRSGFQVRDINRHIIGCSARDIQQAGGAEGHGLYIVGGDIGNQYARDIRIDGFDVYNIAGSAIRDQAPGSVGRRITAERVQGNIISGDGSATGDFEYSEIYGKDVAKNASIGGSYAVALGNASAQKNPRIRDMFVDDPNNNLTALIRRNNVATDRVEITNARGQNSSFAGIPVASSATNTSNIMIRDGYGPTGMSNGPTKTATIASNSIDVSAIYAGGVLLAGTGPLITVVGGDRESELRIWGPSSGTITLNHGSSPDNLVLKGAANQAIGNNQCITFERRGSVWIEVSRNF